jgi:hypothetical protein
MLMLDRRLQVLIDGEHYQRLEDEARARGVPVAVIVREAVDAYLPVTGEERAAAIERILAAEPMAVPDVAGLKAELDELRGRRA